MRPGAWQNGGEVSRALVRSFAALAQLVEHRIRNAGVACSSHAGGTTSKYALPKSVRRRCRKVRIALHLQRQIAGVRSTPAGFCARCIYRVARSKLRIRG